MRPLLRALAATAITFVAANGFAGSASAPMTVSVNVIARAVLNVQSEPSSVEVTTADLTRGYVDVSTPLVVAVKTNSRAGYLLQASQQADFGRVELTFGDASMTLRNGESWISRPYVPGGEVLAMRIRVHLASGTQPGSYPLPIELTARPL